MPGRPAIGSQSFTLAVATSPVGLVIWMVSGRVVTVAAPRWYR